MKSPGQAPLIIAALLLGCLFGWASTNQNLGYRIETLALDHAFQARYALFGPQPMDPRLVLVGVDAETIDNLGKPMLFWQSELASMIDTIKEGEPAVIGVDFIISPKTQKLDETIMEQLQNEGLALGISASTPPPVVLAEMYEVSEFSTNESGGQGYENAQRMSPFETVRDVLLQPDGSTPNLGLVNIAIDQDGSVRRLPIITEEREGKTETANFAFRMLAGASGKPVVYSKDGESSRLTWGDLEVPLLYGNDFLINYPGPTEDAVRRGEEPQPTQSFPIVSAARVLDGQIPASYFKDKYVILGPIADSIGDHQVVPGDGDYRGPAIHLSVLNSFLLSRFLDRSPTLWLLSCALLSMVGALVGRAGRATVLPIGIAVLIGLAFLGFVRYLTWWPAVFWTFSFSAGYGLGYLQRMLTIERDRAVVRSTFARMVSPEVMEYVLEDMSSLTKGRRKDVTVLFTDINGFTPICEKHEPEEIIEMLSEYFSLMVEVILKHDGYLKQYVGDEIMVIYGAPHESEDHATRALRTALEMREVLAEAKKRSNGKPGFYEVKVGLNSGSVVVGKVGPDKRWEYAAVGDSVNLGARVMSTAQKLGIDIGVSAATRRRYLEELQNSPSEGDPIAWTSMGVQQFKGKVSEMEVFGIERKDNT